MSGHVVTHRTYIRNFDYKSSGEEILRGKIV
jgi:hypothetical protein